MFKITHLLDRPGRLRAKQRLHAYLCLPLSSIAVWELSAVLLPSQFSKNSFIIKSYFTCCQILLCCQVCLMPNCLWADSSCLYNLRFNVKLLHVFWLLDPNKYRWYWATLNITLWWWDNDTKYAAVQSHNMQKVECGHRISGLYSGFVTDGMWLVYHYWEKNLCNFSKNCNNLEHPKVTACNENPRLCTCLRTSFTLPQIISQSPVIARKNKISIVRNSQSE